MHHACIFPELGDLQDQDVGTILWQGFSMRGGEPALLSSVSLTGREVQDRSCAGGRREGRGARQAREGRRKEGRVGEGEEGVRWVFVELGGRQEQPDGETRVSLSGPLELKNSGVHQIFGASVPARPVGPGPMCVQTDTLTHAPAHMHTRPAAAHSRTLTRSMPRVTGMPGRASASSGSPG